MPSKTNRLRAYSTYQAVQTMGSTAGDYADLADQCDTHGLEITLLEGLSHRFNTGKEKEFVLAYNNDGLIDRIREILEKHDLRN